MSAYDTKCRLSEKRTEQVIQKFFCQNFDEFVGKHSAWSLLEPDLSHVNPAFLVKTKQDLLLIYNDEVAQQQKHGKSHTEHQDLNHIVALLSEEPEGGIRSKQKSKRQKKSEMKDMATEEQLQESAGHLQQIIEDIDQQSSQKRDSKESLLGKRPMDPNSLAVDKKELLVNELAAENEDSSLNNIRNLGNGDEID